MKGDIKSALWTARTQAESLYPRKEDYGIHLEIKQETGKYIIQDLVGAWDRDEGVERI